MKNAGQPVRRQNPGARPYGINDDKFQEHPVGTRFPGQTELQAKINRSKHGYQNVSAQDVADAKRSTRSFHDYPQNDNNGCNDARPLQNALHVILLYWFSLSRMPRLRGGGAAQ